MEESLKIGKKVFLTSKKCGWASLRASDFSDFRQNGIFQFILIDFGKKPYLFQNLELEGGEGGGLDPFSK